MAEARQLCRLKVRAAMTNDGSDGSAGATAAVTQGSVVVRARLVRTGSCRRWCGSVRQGTVEVQGSDTAAAGAMVQAGALAVALVTLRRLGRGGDDTNDKPTPSSLFISQKGVAEEPFSYNFTILANLAKSASPPALQNFELKY